METESTDIPGCLVVRVKTMADVRGRFTKSYHAPSFASLAPPSGWQEDLHTSSVRGVVRGMHFQLPPAEHIKLVFCVVGEVLDVVLDLRRGSPTYGEHRKFTLSADNGVGLYIPAGCAHGFAAIGEANTMFYKISGVHSPEHDAGIGWDGFGCDWPFDVPLLSDRDRQHRPLEAFESPFVFDGPFVIDSAAPR